MHHLPGRFRIRTSRIKGDASGAKALRDWLACQDGVERAQVNPVTGSALVHYNVRLTDPESLLRGLRAKGVLGEGAGRVPQTRVSERRFPPAIRAEMKRKVANVVLGSVTQLVVERSLLALVAAVF